MRYACDLPIRQDFDEVRHQFLGARLARTELDPAHRGESAQPAACPCCCGDSHEQPKP
jgi:hypothetical protein